jgi:regulatory protein
MGSAYDDAVQMLARRELSAAQLTARLLEREHTKEDVEAAIEQLRDSGALDDARLARAYAETALKVKGRGRLRIQRELNEMGISREVAADALAETFGEVDERRLIAKAITKKLRGHRKIETPGEYARVYQFLMRQGFSPAAVSAALRTLRKGDDPADSV